MLDFTGERFIPSESGEIRYEHMHRYAWAQSLCSGLHVLDIACGEGYGAALIADVAASVVGVDISSEAVAHANRAYSDRPNLRFIEGSATRIPIEDASVDLAISFETLEHLAEQNEMLAELRRVLKPHGLLVISSPNKKVYSDDRNYTNEFHIKELYFDELNALLLRFFPAIKYFGQRFLTVSALLPIKDAAENYDALVIDKSTIRAETAPVENEMYFLAVCSALNEDLPHLKPNLLIEQGVDLYGAQQNIQRWASRLNDEHVKLSAAHIRLQSEFEERTAWALELKDELDVQKEKGLLALEMAAKELDLARARQKELESTAAILVVRQENASRELTLMQSSRSWRLLVSVRRVFRGSR